MSVMGLSAVPPAPATGKFKPEVRTALIVVNVQNCLVAEDTLHVEDGEAFVPLINPLTETFQNTVNSRDWHPAGPAFFAGGLSGKKPFETTRLSYGAQVLWPDHCVQGIEDAALHKDLKLPCAQVFARKGDNRGVDSDGAFEEADGKTATGLAIEFSVAWTAMDTRKSGFEAAVIEDATRDIDLDGTLGAAWKQMTPKGVKRVQSADLLA